MDKWIEWLKTSVWGAMPELNQGAELVLWLGGYGVLLVGILTLLNLKKGGRKLPKNLFEVITLPWRWAIGLACGGFGLFIIYFAMTLVFRLWTTLPENEGDASAIRYHATVLIGCLAAIGGIFTILFAAIRAFATERQTKALEQSHITDQINKAVEGLGAEKTVLKNGVSETKSNMEVRVGALYILKRVSQDSLRDHIQIMEIICSYLRGNAKVENLIPNDEITRRPLPKLDVQTAIDILGDRSEEAVAYEATKSYRLNLQGCNFDGVDFSGGNFSAANMSGSRMEAAVFNGAELTGTVFVECLLNYSIFRDATLCGTIFDRSTFSRGDGWFGGFSGSKISSIYLAGGDFSGSSLKMSDFKKNTTYGDRDTRLPKRFGNKNQMLDTVDWIWNWIEEDGPKEEEVKTVSAAGFEFWSYLGTDDLANFEIRRKFVEHHDLNSWPHR